MASESTAGPEARPGHAADAAFVCFDLETTGLIAGVDRVVEIGAVAFDFGGVRGQFECLVDPGMPIPKEAQRVNHISDEMVKGSPPIKEALPRLLSFIGDAHPIAHNAIFDVGFLCADLDRACLEAPDCPIIDTRALAQKAFPGRRSYSLDSLVCDLGLQVGEEAGGGGGGVPPKVSSAEYSAAGGGVPPKVSSAEYSAAGGGVPSQGSGAEYVRRADAHFLATATAHRALADSFRCRALFLACVEKLRADGPLALDVLVGMGGGPLSFRTHAPSRPRTAATLQHAIEQGHTVEIHYTSDCGENTLRRIMPVSFSILGGSPAVFAFCFLRNADRTFLLDGITDIQEVL